MDKNYINEWLEEWTFKSRDKNRLTHSVHRYPAVFIPDLAQKIIEMYSNEGDTVLDIFSGSGTTVVESIAQKRIGLGIELNPLAHFISEFKFHPMDTDELRTAIEYFYEWYPQYESESTISFDNIEFWFHSSTIKSISDFVSLTSKYHAKINDFFKICLSEILREVSFCNHSGFKMHRNIKKLETEIHDRVSLLAKIRPVIERNYLYVSNYNKLLNSGHIEYAKKSRVFLHDSTVVCEEIAPSSVDLILTSPPYGDSRTTVAYGQFSRLSMQMLEMKTLKGTKVSQVDNELLGGRTTSIDPNVSIVQSLTVQNIQELFLLRAKCASTVEEKKRHLNRLKDILSFYHDLDLSIRNASYYLRLGKFFVLVTASRVVHNTKLHTDQIISEIAHNHGFKLKNIHYRDIHNKRMPSKVSATNITGETAPTMTEESIIILKKIR